MLSIENIFTHDTGSQKASVSGPLSGGEVGEAVGQRSTGVDAAKKTFGAEDGDHMFLLSVYNGYVEAQNKKEWAREHFVNKRSLEKAMVRS